MKKLFLFLSVGLWHKATISLVNDDAHESVLVSLFWKIVSNKEIRQEIYLS